MWEHAPIIAGIAAAYAALVGLGCVLVAGGARGDRLQRRLFERSQRGRSNGHRDYRLPWAA